MSSRKTTDVKELEQKIYTLQKEKNHIINSYESQLDEAKEREKKLEETISQFQKKNSELRKWIRLSGLECELNLESENEEETNNNDDDNDPCAAATSSDQNENYKESNNELINTTVEVPPEKTCQQSDLDAAIEEKNFFEDEMKRLLIELDEKEANYQNIEAKCKTHENSIENYQSQLSESLLLIEKLLEMRNTWRDFLTNEPRFAMLPSLDEFLGLRWDLSYKALPELVLDTIMPTSAVNSITSDMVPLPLMFLPPSSTNDAGFLFRLYLTRELRFPSCGENTSTSSEMHLYIKTFEREADNNASVFNLFRPRNTATIRKLCLMAFFDMKPMETFTKDLPTVSNSMEEEDPVFVMTIPDMFFKPSTGWMIAIR